VQGGIVLPAQLGKVFESFALLAIQACGHLDLDAGEDIPPARTLQRGHSLTANPKNAIALCPRGDLQIDSSGKRWDADFPTQRGDRKGNWHLTMQIHTVALKDRMLFDVNHDVQVAGRSVAQASFSAAGAPEPSLFVDARRDLQLDP
jgi:hypothetical protein